MGGLDKLVISCQQQKNPWLLLNMEFSLSAGYAPITFTGEESAKLTLGYSFFFDLFLHGRFSPIGRKRKRMQTTEGGGEREELHFSFRPTDVQKGTLLYSRTPTSVHTLRVSDNSQATCSLHSRYTPTLSRKQCCFCQACLSSCFMSVAVSKYRYSSHNMAISSCSLDQLQTARYCHLSELANYTVTQPRPV